MKLAHWQMNRSPRVSRTHFLPIYPSHILPSLPDDYRASDLFASLPRDGCLYALRVPRARNLPTASSRPHLTMIALAVQLTVPVIRVRRGLSPPGECALPGAQKKSHGVSSPMALLFSCPWAAPSGPPMSSFSYLNLLTEESRPVCKAIKANAKKTDLLWSSDHE